MHTVCSHTSQLLSYISGTLAENVLVGPQSSMLYSQFYKGEKETVLWRFSWKEVNSSQFCNQNKFHYLWVN